VPWDMRSASHFPIHWIGLSSEFINHDGRGLAGSRQIFSGFYAIDLSGRRRSGERGEEVVCSWPGCLKMPKFKDFLCGWILQEIVWSHRTR
jgi:hypothetical protein